MMQETASELSPIREPAFSRGPMRQPNAAAVQLPRTARPQLSAMARIPAGQSSERRIAPRTSARLNAVIGTTSQTVANPARFPILDRTPCVSAGASPASRNILRPTSIASAAAHSEPGASACSALRPRPACGLTSSPTGKRSSGSAGWWSITTTLIPRAPQNASSSSADSVPESTTAITRQPRFHRSSSTRSLTP